MAFWSHSRPTATATAAAEPVASMDTATLKTELGHAYDRGRSDERARRAGRGVIATLLVVLATVGVMCLALAARDGSFGAAGANVDRTLAQAMSQVGR